MDPQARVPSDDVEVTVVVQDGRVALSAMAAIDPTTRDVSSIDVGVPLVSIAVDPASGDLWGIVFVEPSPRN